MKYEEETWQPYRRIVGYDSNGPLITHGPAPYQSHAEGGEPKARLREPLKITFGNGKLTSFGRRIVEACPPAGIDERALIKKLNGLSAYPDFQRNIAELVKAGYLVQKDGQYKRAE